MVDHPNSQNWQCSLLLVRMVLFRRTCVAQHMVLHPCMLDVSFFLSLCPSLCAAPEWFGLRPCLRPYCDCHCYTESH
jgi:hypothetical protein